MSERFNLLCVGGAWLTSNLKEALNMLLKSLGGGDPVDVMQITYGSDGEVHTTIRDVNIPHETSESLVTFIYFTLLMGGDVGRQSISIRNVGGKTAVSVSLSKKALYDADISETDIALVVLNWAMKLFSSGVLLGGYELDAIDLDKSIEDIEEMNRLSDLCMFSLIFRCRS